MSRRHLGSAALLLCGACTASALPTVALPPVSAPSAPSTATTSLAPPTPAEAPSVERCSNLPTSIGRLRDLQLDEVSGVVESSRNPEVLFIHNDSGDSPRFFAINRAGEILAEFALQTVPLLLDAEDITIARGPDGAPFIYLGDTGNNFASFGQGFPRQKAVLYRIPEPEVSTAWRHVKVPLREAVPIVFAFPDGARDIEAFFIDPKSGDLFMITKHPSGHSQVLTASAAMLAAGGGKLSSAGELTFGAEPLPGSTMPTSAAISSDGLAILVRTYSSVFAFERRAGEPIMSALGRSPIPYPSPREAQGEAIAFVDGARGFVTISEGLRPAVNYVCLKAAAQR